MWRRTRRSPVSGPRYEILNHYVVTRFRDRSVANGTSCSSFYEFLVCLQISNYVYCIFGSIDSGSDKVGRGKILLGETKRTSEERKMGSGPLP